MLGLFKTKKNAVEVTVSNRTIIRALILIILAFLLVTALRRAAHALTLIFLAVFLALALNTPVHWLSKQLPGKRRGSRTLATAISFLVIIGLLIGFLASIVPPMIRQTSTFIKQAPSLVQSAQSEDSSLGRFIRKYNLQDQVDKFSDQLSDRLQNITSSAVNTFARVSGSIFAVLTVLVLTFMMLVEGPRWLEFGKRLVPDDKEAAVEKLAMDMYRVVRGYVNGQVLLATLAASLIAIPLVVLGVSYPVALVVVVFICGLIPLVGHTIGAIIVSTVALFHSPSAAIVILAYYILYQQIENYVIQPRLQASHTDMSPLLVFTSVIIGVSFNGLLGGFVAIPVAGCLRILFLDYLERKQLLEPVKDDTK